MVRAKVGLLCRAYGSTPVLLGLIEYHRGEGLGGSLLSRAAYLELMRAFAQIDRETFDNMGLQTSIDEMVNAGWVLPDAQDEPVDRHEPLVLNRQPITYYPVLPGRGLDTFAD